MVKDLRKAALGYVQWKNTQPHFRKPWRFPEEITVPRICITDCLESPVGIPIPKPKAMTASMPSTPINTPSTPQKVFTRSNSTLSNTSTMSNGDSVEINGTTINAKKSKKRFRFKFDKKSADK